MPTFKLDDKIVPFEPGELIIKAAHRAGIDIPHYCWHPGLSAPANCRMCLVEIKPPPGQRPIMLDILELDPKTGEYKPRTKPKLQPACQIQAAEGMEVLADTSAHVKEARAHVQEFLLLNHPVDCPICDQSGECKLQDYWLAHQRTPKRMRDEPVHKPKGVSFGDTIVYDGERCVMCTRCIRFMEEVAKDPVLDMRERGNLNEIFVAPGRKLEGKYTFMTEHVCPVGALTTKDFRFKARIWFLRTVKSVCQGCATGCNAWLDYDPRYNRVYRYRVRDNEAVNEYWMCDDGMLSYKRAHEGRVLEARVNGKPTSVPRALDAAKKLFESVPKEAVAVVLSAQHSLEDNWALEELGKALIGSGAHYFSGMAPGYADDILIHADKNPNTAGVKRICPDAKPIAQLFDDAQKERVTHVLALGGAVPMDEGAARAALGKLQGLVVIAAHEGPLTSAANVVLPAASWAEAGGTYVNALGFEQIADKAIEPQGSSAPGWRMVARLADALGFEASWSKLEEIRARLVPAQAPHAPHASPSTAPKATSLSGEAE
jgi:NADH-quinone oxidoreductase subunit G